MLPELPTDNLYKFSTLGGIALLAFGVWQLDQTFAKNSEIISQRYEAKYAVDDSTGKLQNLTQSYLRAQTDGERTAILKAHLAEQENSNTKTILMNRAEEKHQEELWYLNLRWAFSSLMIGIGFYFFGAGYSFGKSIKS